MLVLILGASGMIGSTMARVVSENTHYKVHGIGRRDITQQDLKPSITYHQCEDLTHEQSLKSWLNELNPDVIINCLGLTKHYKEGNEPLHAIRANALFPHMLAKHALDIKARVIHVSTDCVFDGVDGFYDESFLPNAKDVYGRSKALGELDNLSDVTLRTSTIGHELGSHVGLLEWFLSQKKCVVFERAIFSGLPTVEFAKVIRDIVIPNHSLVGLFNVGAKPISKANLLKIISEVYEHKVHMSFDDSFVIDRSLNSGRFQALTGYSPPSWPILITKMFNDYRRSFCV